MLLVIIPTMAGNMTDVKLKKKVMPAIRCKCDNIISYSEIPNPNELLMISDVKYDDYSGVIDSEDLYKEMTHILKCDGCGRLWIYWDGFKNNPLSYLPEND